MIGIVDSGLGGLSVARVIQEQLPDTGIVYLGDNARVPYGTRSRSVIRQFARELANFFHNQPIEALVVACHTMSVTALSVIQESTEVPVVDVAQPTITHLQDSGYKQVLLLGTQATANSGVYPQALQEARVTSLPAPLLVSLAEYGPFSDGLVRGVLSEYVEEPGTFDAVVLGCTHFPIFFRQIQEFFPSSEVVNPAFPATQKVEKVITYTSDNQESKFYFTDTPHNLPEAAEKFLGHPLPNYSLIDVTELHAG